ncbi:MAG TPA: gamma-glutamylcyclotransferase [Opitutaceae bacterium]|jgi:protein phosphatase
MADAPDGHIKWSAHTDVGRHRPNNEDRFLALRFDGHDATFLGKDGDAALTGTDFVFAVSDGMGGAKSGEFASRIAVDRITRLLPRSFRLGASGIAAGFSDVLLELFSSIHADLIRLGQSYSECAGMGATLSLCWLRPGWLYFGHVGDSRIYYLPKAGGITQLTHDHTHVGWLRRKGEINEREARGHPRRNALQQALGAGTQFVEPQIGAVAYGPGDRFLVCSDGVVDGLWDRRIEEIVRSRPGAEGAARAIVDEAVAESGRDNATALVIEAPSGKGRTLLFVYGTLKRDGTNHHYLGGQAFVGPARTPPGYVLFDLSGYPGMIAEAGGPGVGGEVWAVDDECLGRLDQLEGTEEGLFRRAPVPLEGAHAADRVEAYLYLPPVGGRPRIGGDWSG